MILMKKKRKGSESETCLEEELKSICISRFSLSSRKTHFSFEDAKLRLKKRYKEGDSTDDASSFKSRLDGVATDPPCGVSTLVALGRGIKRKIGCIDVATQMGRKNKLEDDYILDSTIGQGKFGSVWLCKSKNNGSEFACKTLIKGEETVHREVEIMQHLSGHNSVVTLQAVYEDEDSFHLVMELCSGGRLIDHMNKDGQWSENKATHIFKEVMLVIKYCHDMGVVHRDIKPENILLTSTGKIKLADFGLAMRVASGQSLSGLVGSASYVAPEVLLGNYTEKVDIWSAGVLLHLFLVGALPFQGDSLEAVFEAIKTVKLDFHTGVWKSVSRPARNLVERMLTRDASARISVEEALRHPWIMFYTERNLKTISMKSKSKNLTASPTRQLEITPQVEPSRKRASINISPSSISDGSSEKYRSNLEEEEEEEQDDESSLVDALTVAVSHVRISEPKRSRICVSPIPQQCSSNISSNNLCKAF